jgi:tetratricopeptide (TPR) repeat protein
MIPFLRISSLALMALAALAIVTCPARAEEGDLKARAKQHVNQGLIAQDEHRYDDAIAAYDQAYELVPHPEILFNLGQVYRLKGDHAASLHYYRKYLAVDGKGRVAPEAKRWIAKLEKMVSPAETQAFEERAEQQHRQARAKAAAPPPAPVATEEPTPEKPRSRWTTKRKIAVGLVGVSVASWGVGVGLEFSGRATYDEYERTIGSSREALFDRANRKHHLAQGLAIGGAACIAAAAVLWFTGGVGGAERAPQDQSPHATALIGPGITGLAIVGGFR